MIVTSSHPAFVRHYVCVFLSASALLLALTGCGSKIQQTPETRTVEAPAAAGDTSSAHRFGDGSMSPHGEMAQESHWVWKTPEGWQEGTPTSMRKATFRVGPQGEAECYLTVLGGAAGGVAMNANRWRTQLGAAELGDAEIAALPKVQILGGEAVIVEAEGTYGAGAADSAHTEGREQADAALLGAILPQPDRVVFVKMVGPKNVVAAQREAFLSFCRSLEEHNHSADVHAHGESAPVEAQSSASAEQAPAADATSSLEAKLRWQTPDTWKEQPKRSMRVVSFAAGPNGEVECYVTVLAGSAGGFEANLNRWRQQMGQPELTPDEMAALPKVSILGGEGAMLEQKGAYTDMAGQKHEGQALLGALREVPGQVVFVKMTGPEAAVMAEKERFLAFCKSLQ